MECKRVEKDGHNNFQCDRKIDEQNTIPTKKSMKPMAFLLLTVTSAILISIILSAIYYLSNLSMLIAILICQMNCVARFILAAMKKIQKTIEQFVIIFGGIF